MVQLYYIDESLCDIYSTENWLTLLKYVVDERWAWGGSSNGAAWTGVGVYIAINQVLESVMDKHKLNRGRLL